MTLSIRRRIAVVATIIVVVVIAAALAGLHVLQRRVEARVVEVLGPLGSAQRIDVGFTAIRLHGVRLAPPPGWPAGDPLRADTVVLVPDLGALLSHRVHLRKITVRGFDLAILRSADGRIRLLPNLRASTGRAGTGAGGNSGNDAATPPPRNQRIDHVDFENGRFEFYDETVRRPAYHVSIGDARASVGPLQLPALDEPTNLDVTGTLKGPQHTGTVAFGGWVRVSNRDSQTHTTLRGVDLAVLDPYLLQKAGADLGVKSGTADLSVQSTVHNHYLNAPGTLTLHNLELASGGGPLDTFLSIPRQAAVAALKNRRGNITLHFTLAGNLNDPSFSLNESFAKKLGAGLAEALGVSAQGVAKGVGETAKGIGNALKSLLGQ